MIHMKTWSILDHLLRSLACSASHGCRRQPISRYYRVYRGQQSGLLSL